MTPEQRKIWRAKNSLIMNEYNKLYMRWLRGGRKGKKPKLNMKESKIEMIKAEKTRQLNLQKKKEFNEAYEMYVKGITSKEEYIRDIENINRKFTV
jgi:hypothetical protein